jgi:UDP-2,4-diacetamido-2,4,6-trideoxy-beta-L-altropyranose hydrolase
MRCLALAQAWQDIGGHSVFVMAKGVLKFKERLLKERMVVIPISKTSGSKEDADQTCVLANQMAASWIVVDGYHFGTDYQKILRQPKTMAAVIDDNSHLDRYFGNLIINHNIHARSEMYSSKASDARLLIGTSYFLLRREFRPLIAAWKGVEENVERILVSFGGGDKNNLTLLTLKALSSMGLTHLKVEVVIGPNNANFQKINRYVQSQKLECRVVRDVENMPELFNKSDLIISAGGTTLLEAASLGLPAIVVTAADNQRVANELLSEIGAIEHAGEESYVDETNLGKLIREIIEKPDRRRALSNTAKDLVDGDGAKRVAYFLQSLGR